MNLLELTLFVFAGVMVVLGLSMLIWRGWREQREVELEWRVVMEAEKENERYRPPGGSWAMGGRWRVKDQAPSTAALLYARAGNDAGAADHTAWAMGQLEAGVDSPSLRILAGLIGDEDPAEVERYFRRTFAELGWVMPDFPTRMRNYAEELCREIGAGTLEPEAGVRRLYPTCLAMDYADEYRVWLDLEDGLDLLQMGEKGGPYEGLTLENFDATVRWEAARFLATAQASEAS